MKLVLWLKFSRDKRQAEDMGGGISGPCSFMGTHPPLSWRGQCVGGSLTAHPPAWRPETDSKVWTPGAVCPGCRGPSQATRSAGAVGPPRSRCPLLTGIPISCCWAGWRCLGGSEDALQTGEHSWHRCLSAWQYALCADAALEQSVTWKASPWT